MKMTNAEERRKSHERDQATRLETQREKRETASERLMNLQKEYATHTTMRVYLCACVCVCARRVCFLCLLSTPSPVCVCARARLVFSDSRAACPSDGLLR